jgi:hypothetical protein
MEDASAPRYFLFPHAALSEPETRHLGLLLPQLYLLQVIRPVAVAAGDEGQFVAYPVVHEDAFRERVQLYLRGYHDFASIHRDSGSLAGLGEQFGANDLEASRFLLQGELRGKSPLSPDMSSWLRLEAAVFLELARDYDEKELELETQYQRMQELEEGFRQILGVIDGEEMEEVIETVNPSLTPDQSRLSFMLKKRMACWYRLLAVQELQPFPSPLALSREVVAELLDLMETEAERAGRDFSMVQRPVAMLPGLHHLPAEQFRTLRQELQRHGHLRPYWQALGEVWQNPRAQDVQVALQSAVQNLRDQIFQFCLQQNVHPKKQVVLVLTRVEGVTHQDLWMALDRTGYEHLANEASPLLQTAALLHMEWQE